MKAKTRTETREDGTTYEVYLRHDEYDDNKKIDGLTKDELKEAFQIYGEKVNTEIIESLERKFGISLDNIDDDGEMLSYFNYVMDLAFTKGMELAVNRGLLTGFYAESKNIIIDKLTHYDFEIGKGVSGVLTPEGNFLKCGNAEHHLITEQAAKGLEFGCIYFSSFLTGFGQGNISYAPVGFKGVTTSQNWWMSNNKIYFDPSQMEIYEGKLLDGKFEK